MKSANRAKPDQTPQNAASDQVLHCLLTEVSFKIIIKMKIRVFVAEKWIEKVFEVKRVSDRIILVKIIVGQRVLCLLSVYAPQCGL